MDLNLVVLTGRLTRDLELRATDSGKSCCYNCIAVDKGKDSNGNKREAVFVNFMVWENTAEFLTKFAEKGSRVTLTGSLEQRKVKNDQTDKIEYQLYFRPNNVQIIDWKKTGDVVPTSESEETTTILNDDEIEISPEDLPF